MLEEARACCANLARHWADEENSTFDACDAKPNGGSCEEVQTFRVISCSRSDERTARRCRRLGYSRNSVPFMEDASIVVGRKPNVKVLVPNIAVQAEKPCRSSRVSGSCDLESKDA